MCSATEYVYLTTAQTDKPEYNAPYYNIPLLGSRFLPNPVILPESFHKDPHPPKESLITPESKQTASTSTSETKRPSEKKLSPYKSGKLRPYSCDECGKTFLMKHHLTTHARTHTGEKPHSCVYCGKSFTHKHCLNTHLLLHSKQRPFLCETCKKSFTLKHHLLTHLKVIVFGCIWVFFD